MDPIYTVICWGVWRMVWDGQQFQADLGKRPTLVRRLEVKQVTWTFTHDRDALSSDFASALKYCARETVAEDETPRRIYQTDKPDDCKARFLRDFAG